MSVRPEFLLLIVHRGVEDALLFACEGQRGAVVGWHLSDLDWGSGVLRQGWQGLSTGERILLGEGLS